MLKTINIDLLYQPSIDAPPPQLGDLYEHACSGDGVTVDAWKEIWIKNMKANKEHFGSFASKTIGKLYKSNAQKPAIVIGSGPSLKDSIVALKENAEAKSKVLTISCLHNFGYFEDEGFHADYYLSLDSGPIVMKDVSEGRKLPAEEYWAKTKGKTLLAYVASDPELFKLWQGDVYLFNCLIPDLETKEALNAIEKFSHYVSCGGNALGGCMYVAKAIMGSDAIHYVGADFCFDYDNTFHSYSTHYDQPGAYVVHPDCFGVPRKSWRSYMNFKFFFDHIAMTIPGRWINCSGGVLGAYPSGNLKHFEYRSLENAMDMYRMNERVFLESREEATGKVLDKKRIDLEELFQNAEHEFDLVLF